MKFNFKVKELKFTMSCMQFINFIIIFVRIILDRKPDEKVIPLVVAQLFYIALEEIAKMQ